MPGVAVTVVELGPLKNGEDREDRQENLVWKPEYWGVNEMR